VLDLTANQISTLGLIAFADALRGNTTLKHLILVRNQKLSFRAATAFRDALKYNSSLIRLVLPFNARTKNDPLELVAEISASLKRNAKTRSKEIVENTSRVDIGKKQELEDIRSDFRTLKSVNTQTSTKRKRSEDNGSVIGKRGNSKQRVKRARKLHKQLRDIAKLEVLDVALLQPSQRQKIAKKDDLKEELIVLSCSRKRQDDTIIDALQRRLLQIEKLENLQRSGATLNEQELNKIARKGEFVDKLQHLSEQRALLITV